MEDHGCTVMGWFCLAGVGLDRVILLLQRKCTKTVRCLSTTRTEAPQRYFDMIILSDCFAFGNSAS
jgi:hypothetical protein